MKVAMFSGGAAVPSARLRVHQHVEPLQKHGVAVTLYDARRSSYPPSPRLVSRAAWFSGEVAHRALQVGRLRHSKPDVSLVQREFVSTLATLERFVPSPMVFDVDDAIWLIQNRWSGSDLIARRSDLIIAGNRFLADRYSDFARTVVVPTAVDVFSYRVGRGRPEDRHAFGWSGTSSGFKYLELIEVAIRQTLKLRPHAVFRVMADRPPSLALPPAQFEFVPWSPSAEVGFLESLGIGIMPLADGDWERGKCSYKMLSYMASGLPVVVSPVGMNQDLLTVGEIGFGATTQDEWTQAIVSLLDDDPLADRLGANGRSIAEGQYSVGQVAACLASALRSVSS